LIFKLGGFNKRIDVGQVLDRQVNNVREQIVDHSQAFIADKIKDAIQGDKEAGTPQAEAAAGVVQIANWVLICVRYFDAVKANMKMTLQNQAPGGIEGPAFADACLAVRNAIPKALESFHVNKVPVLYDPKSLAATFLSYNKAKIINAVDPRLLFKGPLNKVLCHCLEHGVPLVIDTNDISDDSVELPAKFEAIQAGLYDDLLLNGKSKDAAFVQQLAGDSEITLKKPDGFGLFILTKVDRVPTWLVEESYVTIEVT